MRFFSQRARWCLALLVLLSVCGFALFSARSGVHAAGATITLSATVAPPSTPLVVSGAGYGPSQNVLIKVDTTTVGKAQTDATGAFSASITIPAGALPGHHTIFAASTASPRVSGHTGVLVQTDWPMAGYDAGRTNTNPYENVLSPTTVSGLVLGWKRCIPGATCFPTQQESVFTGAFVGGLLYVGTHGSVSRLWALRPKDGTRVWVAGRVRRRDVSSPAVANGRVYFSLSGTRSLLAVDARSGAGVWSTHGNFSSSPIVADGIVYISSSYGNLFVYDAATGVPLWNAHNATLPVVSGTLAYTNEGIALIALDTHTGAIVWTQPGLSVATTLGGVLYGYAATGQLVALDGQTGALLWQVTAGNTVIAASGGVIYTRATDGTLFAVDAVSGALLWSYALTCNVSILANGVLYGQDTAGMCAIDAHTGGLLWSYAGISDPQVVNGVLYATDKSNIYAFHLPNMPL